MSRPLDIRRSSIRTLAWIGDAEWERIIRRRLAGLGDYPVDRLERMRARLARAETQAELLDAILPRLEPEELDVVRRARNARFGRSGVRSDLTIRTYRAASAFEALVGWWACGLTPFEGRFEVLVGGELSTRLAAMQEELARERANERSN
jgi:ribonuclease-3 family protein